MVYRHVWKNGCSEATTKVGNDQEAKSNEYQLQVIYSNKLFDFYEAWSIKKMRFIIDFFFFLMYIYIYIA